MHNLISNTDQKLRFFSFWLRQKTKMPFSQYQNSFWRDLIILQVKIVLVSGKMQRWNAKDMFMESIIRANIALEPSELPGCSDLIIYSFLRQQCELGVWEGNETLNMWFPSLSKKWSFQWQHFPVGRKEKKSISNGFNIERWSLGFQAPLSTDGSLPRLDNIMYPTDKGQWERWWTAGWQMYYL